MKTEQHAEPADQINPTVQKPVRVLLAGGQRLDRQGLRALLERDPGFKVVADAAGGASAVDQAGRLLPDVIVWEPLEAGLAASGSTRALTSACPGVRVAVLLPHPSAALVRQCLDAGAKAVMGKDCGASDLTDAISAVQEGKTYLCQGAAALLASQPASVSAKGSTPGVPLTHREQEVLRLVAQGQSTKAIARTLGISVRTVDAHRRNLKTKLGRRSVAGLTQHAIRQGLVSID